MDFRKDRDESARRQPDEPLVLRDSSPGLPNSLDPVITLGAVQRYVESERQRNRRAVLWMGTVFLLALVVILIVSALIGIVVIKNSTRAVDLSNRVYRETAAYVGGIAAVSNRLTDLETLHIQVRKSVTQWEDRFARGTLDARAEIEKINREVASSNLGVSQALATVQARMAQLVAEAGKKPAPTAEHATPASVMAVKSPGNEVPDVEMASAASEGSGPGPGLTNMTNEADFAVEDVPAVKPPETPMDISVVTFPNGDRYEGQFKDGLFNGWGIYFYHDGDRYEGEFADDMKSGRGTFVYRLGDRYTGSFSNDMKWGKGSLLFSNGDRFVGDFSNDMLSGHGTMLYRNGNRYSGEFKNGLKHGNGVFTFGNGDSYRGEFSSDMRNGKGVYQSSDGARYTGEVKGGKRHGQGRYVYADGQEYNGEFRNGKKDGYGVYTYPNGKTIKALWRDDKFVKSVGG